MSTACHLESPPPADLAPLSCLICKSEHSLRRAEYRPSESVARKLGRRVMGVDLCSACAARSDLEAVIEACLIADAGRPAFD